MAYLNLTVMNSNDLRSGEHMADSKSGRFITESSDTDMGSSLNLNSKQTAMTVMI